MCFKHEISTAMSSIEQRMPHRKCSIRFFSSNEYIKMKFNIYSTKMNFFSVFNWKFVCIEHWTRKEKNRIFFYLITSKITLQRVYELLHVSYICYFVRWYVSHYVSLFESVVDVHRVHNSLTHWRSQRIFDFFLLTMKCEYNVDVTMAAVGKKRAKWSVSNTNIAFCVIVAFGAVSLVLFLFSSPVTNTLCLVTRRSLWNFYHL